MHDMDVSMRTSLMIWCFVLVGLIPLHPSSSQLHNATINDNSAKEDLSYRRSLSLSSILRERRNSTGISSVVKHDSDDGIQMPSETYTDVTTGTDREDSQVSFSTRVLTSGIQTSSQTQDSESMETTDTHTPKVEIHDENEIWKISISTKRFNSRNTVTPATFSSSSNGPYPNCTGINVDMINKITYCQTPWGTKIILEEYPLYETSTHLFNSESTSSVWNLNVHLPGIEHMLQMSCPHWLSCPDKSKSHTTSKACCMQCDCSKTCFDTGTCCFAKQLAYADESWLRRSKTDQCTKTSAGDASTYSKHTYLLVQTCSNITSGIERDIVNNCLTPNETSLNNIVPFYSDNSGTNYRNIFCAICNDDSLLGRHWDGYFSSTIGERKSDINNEQKNGTILLFRRTIENMHDILTVDRKVPENRQIYWEPVSSNSRYCVDRGSIIGTCENSAYDGSLFARYCSMYYAPVIGKSAIYKNIHCQICNEREGIGICKQRREEQDFFRTKLTLNKLLDVDAESQIFVKAIQQNKTCPTGKTFDGVLGECIQKACAITEVNVGETCSSIMTNVSGISLDYRFTVYYPLSTTISSFDSTFESLHEISLISSDDICFQRILEIETQDMIISVKVQIITHVKTPRNIADDFQQLKDQVANINRLASVGKGPFEVELDNLPLDPVNAQFVSIGEFNDNNRYAACGPSLALSNIQFCDIVLLDKFTLSINGIVRHKNISFFPGEYGVMTVPDAETAKDKFTQSGTASVNSVFVCYEMYVSKMLKSRNETFPNDFTVNEDVSSSVYVFRCSLYFSMYILSASFIPMQI